MESRVIYDYSRRESPFRQSLGPVLIKYVCLTVRSERCRQDSAVSVSQWTTSFSKCFSLPGQLLAWQKCQRTRELSFELLKFLECILYPELPGDLLLLFWIAVTGFWSESQPDLCTRLHQLQQGHLSPVVCWPPRICRCLLSAGMEWCFLEWFHYATPSPRDGGQCRGWNICSFTYIKEQCYNLKSGWILDCRNASWLADCSTSSLRGIDHLPSKVISLRGLPFYTSLFTVGGINTKLGGQLLSEQTGKLGLFQAVWEKDALFLHWLDLFMWPNLSCLVGAFNLKARCQTRARCLSNPPLV